MSEQQSASILAICVDESTAAEVSEGQSYFPATSARQAIDLLRMLKFDLVITGMELPDMPVFRLVSKIKTAWPWQKWALVANELTPQDEVIVRTLGVTRIFHRQIEREVLTRMGDRGHFNLTEARQAKAS